MHVSNMMENVKMKWSNAIYFDAFLRYLTISQGAVETGMYPAK